MSFSRVARGRRHVFVNGTLTDQLDVADHPVPTGNTPVGIVLDRTLESGFTVALTIFRYAIRLSTNKRSLRDMSPRREEH